MTTTTAPYRSQVPAGHAGFGPLLRAEWTKFRTVRGWVIGLLTAIVATVGLSVLTAQGSMCSNGPFGPGQPALACTAPIGPDGEVVSDGFYFVHQQLTGNGTLTAQVTSLTGSAGLQPWTKAGIIVKASLTQGSAYTAMLATGGHGVRFQYDYTHDTPGLPGLVSAGSPRWLRLVRAGETITGYDSPDGTHWTRAGTATLSGLPATVQVGLLTTSPPDRRTSHVKAGATATGSFGHIALTGAAAGSWTGTDLGYVGPADQNPDGFQRTGSGFTITGHGDIAPDVDSATQLTEVLSGAFGGLIAVIVVGVMFVTAEYRAGLIRTTLAASPARGQVLAAKAVVIAAVTFVTALAAILVTVPLAERILRKNGNFIAPLPELTQLRVETGTAAVFALCAVLALAAGVIARRGVTAVTAVICGVVLPYVLAVSTPALPLPVTTWLLRCVPAAAFAIQQTTPRSPLVDASYNPFSNFFPLTPWAGLAVLCAWTAGALALATFLLQRRDA